MGKEDRGRRGQTSRRAQRRGREDEGAGAGESRAALGQRDSAQGQRLFRTGGSRPPVQAMIAFIDDHRDARGVEPICKVLPITPSTYHERLAQRRDPARQSARAQRDQTFRPEIARAFAGNFAVYGVRKVWGADAARAFPGCSMHRGAADGRDGPSRRDPGQTGAHDSQR